MSYSLLGTSCMPHTIACTSNHKFLPLQAPIYKKQHTYMLQYPGGSVISDNLSRIAPKHDDHFHPEFIKSYYGKNCENNNTNMNNPNFNPSLKIQESPPERMIKSCTNC